MALSSSPSWHDRLWLEVSHFVLKMSDLSFSEAEGGVRKKVEGGRGVRRGRRGVGGESMISSTSFLGNSIVGGGSIGNVSSVSSLSVLSSSSSTFSSSSPSSAEFLGANIGDILGELGRDFDEDKMDPFLVMQKKIMMGNFDELVFFFFLIHCVYFFGISHLITQSLTPLSFSLFLFFSFSLFLFFSFSLFLFFSFSLSNR